MEPTPRNTLCQINFWWLKCVWRMQGDQRMFSIWVFVNVCVYVCVCGWVLSILIVFRLANAPAGLMQNTISATFIHTTNTINRFESHSNCRRSDTNRNRLFRTRINRNGNHFGNCYGNHLPSISFYCFIHLKLSQHFLSHSIDVIIC